MVVGIEFIVVVCTMSMGIEYEMSVCTARVGINRKACMYQWCTASEICDCNSTLALAEYILTPFQLRDVLKFCTLTPA